MMKLAQIYELAWRFVPPVAADRRLYEDNARSWWPAHEIGHLAVPRRDLSIDAQRNVLACLRALRSRFGNWISVERAVPVSHSQPCRSMTCSREPRCRSIRARAAAAHFAMRRSREV